MTSDLKHANLFYSIINPTKDLKIINKELNLLVPTFRKYQSFTAFVEGWGLYSEELGEFMNLYDDPYDKFGQLTYDMWRAIRLVVDTGMHYKDWSRQDAIDLFIENKC